MEKAQILFPEYIVTTSSFGSNSYKKTDWTPLKDRNLVIWPDNDEHGKKYAKNVTQILNDMGAKNTKIVDIPEDFPEKWDLADEIPEGYRFKDIQSLLETAKEKDIRDLGFLKSISEEDLLSMEIPPREYLLKPIISEKSLNMVFAQRGIGKTWFSLSLAHALATGGKFLEWEAVREVKVLYIDGEMPLKTLQERLQTISDLEGGSTKNLKILSADYHLDGIPPITTEEANTLLEDHIQWAEFVILDNLATLYPTTQQNEVEGWLPIQEWLLAMRRAGKSVLLVHHSGKNGGQRGTSAKEDILDLSLELKKPADYTAKNGAMFEIHFSKARGVFGNDAEPFIAQLTQKGWQVREIENKTVLAHKLVAEGLTQREIAEKLNTSPSSVNRMLQEKPKIFKNQENMNII
ncbi:MAG: AAA family ATPase [Alphaproteobacteria bacterium]|nr:AAA family ATPase [Alphaproteobacteria bacterium]